MQRAVFLDRDGVINAVVWNAQEQATDSPYRLEDFQLLPSVPEAVRRIRELGFLAVVVSNQPGVAKGKCSFQLLDDLTHKMQAELAAYGAELDAVYYCCHHPDASLAELRVDCACRKPKPGLIQYASQDLLIDPSQSYMIGDQERDVEAGLAAGCVSIRVQGYQNQLTKANLTAVDLPQAVSLIATRSGVVRPSPFLL